MDRWHLGRSGQTFGPYTWSQVVEMARSGQILPADLLWQEGSTASWAPASTFGNRLVFGGAAPPMPPPPPPPGTPPRSGGQEFRTFVGTLPPGGGAPGGDKVKIFGKRLGFHSRRAAAWNLHDIEVAENETKELIRLGVDDEEARRFHAWRRSVLAVTIWGGVIAATLGTLTTLAALGAQPDPNQPQQQPQLSELGNFLEIVRVVSLWFIPVFAYRAAKAWAKHKRSRRLLAIGWVVSFATPLLLALIPAHWRYNLEGGGFDRAQAEASLRLLGAIASYVTLMPAVLALIPGIMRACLRIKVLLPQSILPGWFLVGMAPFWMFLFLVVFVTINQIAGDAMLILGILAITAAPGLYLLHVALITRPISTKEELQKLLAIQKQVRIVLVIGVVFLLIWLFTATVFGKSLVGTDEMTSHMRPWNLDLLAFPIEYATHSLFTMALAADLFMVMNLSVWVHTRQFVASPEAKDYDRRMTEIEEAGSME